MKTSKMLKSNLKIKFKALKIALKINFSALVVLVGYFFLNFVIVQNNLYEIKFGINSLILANCLLIGLKIYSEDIRPIKNKSIEKRKLRELVEFHFGWDNLTKRQEKIFKSLVDGEIPKNLTKKELMGLEMIGVIEK